MRSLVIVLLAAWSLAFSCRERQENIDTFAYVQKPLYTKLVEELKSNQESKEVFVLYSQSGMSNAGQYEIHGNQLRYSKANQKTFTTHTLTEKQLSTFKNLSQKWVEYQDYTPKVLDGIQFNYFHITANNGNVKVVKRLFMNSPSPTAKSAEAKNYHGILKAFQSLKPKDS